LDREARIRKVERSEREFFFDWNAPGEDLVIKGGYHSMISEAYKAAYDLRIGIDYKENDNKIQIWTDEKLSEVGCEKGEVSKTI
jgi:hypothetical protein